jgi:hypothetical protein
MRTPRSIPGSCLSSASHRTTAQSHPSVAMGSSTSGRPLEPCLEQAECDGRGGALAGAHAAHQRCRRRTRGGCRGECGVR